MDINKQSHIALILRRLLSEPTGSHDIPFNPVIINSQTDKKVIDLVSSSSAQSLKNCPEPLNKIDKPVLHLSSLEYDSHEKLAAQMDSAVRNYTTKHGCKPQAVCCPGVAVFYVTSGESDSSAPLKNKIALVTGSAGAIGYGICKTLLEKGSRVAVTDLPGDRLDDFVNEFKNQAGDYVVGVPMDVTDKDSVARSFEKVTEAWGGIDIVVVNAGIALVCSLIEMDIDEFRKLEKVNVEGTLLTLAEAGRHFKLQGIGGDIVVISTKNVFAPGAKFGAYSATKAASHQLARIASLEFAEFGVRVNMVSPDAVFSGGKYKSGLWQQVGPDRMRARGLDEKGLEEYYRNRNLLKTSVTAQHVANAVLFFATRQTPTTGATIPVDGGLPDATPR